MTDWILITQQLGFPIAVACYLIWDRIKLMNKFIETMNSHTNAINLLIEKLGEHNKK